MRMSKGLVTTAQEYNGKFTVPIPTGLAKLLGIKKGDTFIWNMCNDNTVVTIIKADIVHDD